MIRNESDRYLQSSLVNLAAQVDEVFVYDDSSDDSSRDIAERIINCTMESRPETATSFVENEGAFRNHGWESFVEKMNPSDGDWIVCLDADEFIVSSLPLREIVDNHSRGLRLHVPEAWELDPETTQVKNVAKIRIDGFWNTNYSVRIFPFKSGLHFRNREMGVGAAPIIDDYVEERGVAILHCGYAEEIDRIEKYRRYKTYPKGHNPKHIDSILAPATLVFFSGKIPEIWRGVL